jgi:hypothetical protein
VLGKSASPGPLLFFKSWRPILPTRSDLKWPIRVRVSSSGDSSYQDRWMREAIPWVITAMWQILSHCWPVSGSHILVPEANHQPPLPGLKYSSRWTFLALHRLQTSIPSYRGCCGEDASPQLTTKDRATDGHRKYLSLMFLRTWNSIAFPGLGLLGHSLIYWFFPSQNQNKMQCDNKSVLPWDSQLME